MYVPPKVIIFSVAVAFKVTALSIFAYKMHQVELKKREEIELWKQEEIDAIQKSAAIVNAKIQHGDYDKNHTLEDALTDFQFYKIAIQEEQ